MSMTKSYQYDYLATGKLAPVQLFIPPLSTLTRANPSLANLFATWTALIPA